MNKYYLIKFLKILLLGDIEVGKSAILKRYCYNLFDESDNKANGLDCYSKKIYMEDGKSVNLLIYDIPGREYHKRIDRNYYLDSRGFMLIYDVTNIESFNNLENRLKDIKLNTPYNTPIILVGNKIDKIDRRGIAKEKGEELAKKYGVMFSECSAKTGENVDFIFDELIKEEKKRREIEEEKAKKNFKILNKYISY